MDRERGSDGSCYYSIVRICKDVSSDIRTAYSKLALVLYILNSPISSIQIHIYIYIYISYFVSVCVDLMILVVVLKWHPDGWVKNPAVAGEASCRFQNIQEAYTGCVTEF